jgi:SulP family sulfate permease
MGVSIKSYFQKDALPDVLSGVTVAAILIPQALAYAVLAGLPASYGLYAALVPTLVYPLLGRVHYLSVGPTALMSILVYSGIQGLEPSGPEEFIALCLSVSLLSGVFQMMMGALKLGYVVRFISKPVLNGFISAAALIILSSQLKYFLGLRIERAGGFINTLVELVKGLSHIPRETGITPMLLVVGFGICSIFLIRIVKKKSVYFPTALLLVATSIFIFYNFPQLREQFHLLGDVHLAVPRFQVPNIGMETLKSIVPVSLSVAIISFIESYAISKGLAEDGMKMQPNRELVALGLSKVVGSFFQAFPTTGSFSRSAISKASGARTGVSSVLTALVVLGVILLAGNLFSYAPYFLLAAIIISAVMKLIDIKTPKALLKQHRKDFFSLIVTFVSTLVFGVQWGLLIGIGFSVLLLMMYHSKPLFSILYRQKNGEFRDANRYPNAEFHPSDTLVFRFDQDLVFWNASYFLIKTKEAIEAEENIKKVILDGKAMVTLDSTGADAMRQLIEYCQHRGLTFKITGLKGEIRDAFRVFELDKLLSKQDFELYSIDQAFKQ